MPRKSASAFAELRVDGRPSRVRPRADVPTTLKPIIIDLIASVPPEHFRNGDVVLIEMYAAAIALSRQAYDELERNGPVIDGKASPWIAVLEKTHRSSAVLAARLRLTPQMRTDPKTAGRRAGPPPSYYDQMRLEESDDGRI
jgi:Phage terminase, small subunit